jgi:hypothetical protein
MLTKSNVIFSISLATSTSAFEVRLDFGAGERRWLWQKKAALDKGIGISMGMMGCNMMGGGGMMGFDMMGSGMGGMGGMGAWALALAKQSKAKPT